MDDLKKLKGKDSTMHKPSDYCDHCGRASSSDCLLFCDWTEMWLCDHCLYFCRQEFLDEYRNQ